MSRKDPGDMRFRIISGRHRGRVFTAPLTGKSARPTLGRVREAVFSILRPHLPGCVFVDLFAGTGQMGLEALSEGAASVWWVEENPSMAGALRQNLEKIGESPTQVLQAPANWGLKQLAGRGVKADFVYVDAPFGGDLTPLLPALAQLTAPQGCVLVETDQPQPPDFSPFLALHRRRDYGRIRLLDYRLCDPL